MIPYRHPIVYVFTAVVPASDSRNMKERPKECAASVAFDHCPDAQELVEAFQRWYPELSTPSRLTHLMAIFEGYESETLLHMLDAEEADGRSACISNRLSNGVTITAARGPLS